LRAFAALFGDEMSLCNQCGACCRVLTLEQSPEEVRSIAAVTKALGIPSDHQFAAEHWHPLTREEAMERNVFYASRLPADAHLYWCDRLGTGGRCMAYDDRPLVCRGYPWYGGEVKRVPLPDPKCGYAYEQVLKFVLEGDE
jgi:Fe-S-cluster containining protein